MVSFRAVRLSKEPTDTRNLSIYIHTDPVSTPNSTDELHTWSKKLQKCSKNIIIPMISTLHVGRWSTRFASRGAEHASLIPSVRPEASV